MASCAVVRVAGVGDPVAQCPFDALLCHFGICTPLSHQKCTDGTITPVAKTKALDTVLALMALQYFRSITLPVPGSHYFV